MSYGKEARSLYVKKERHNKKVATRECFEIKEFNKTSKKCVGSCDTSKKELKNEGFKHRKKDRCLNAKGTYHNRKLE